MVIRVLTTGGTIDSLEYDSEDEHPAGQKSMIPELLKRSRIDLNYEIEEVLFKESKLITDEERNLILLNDKKLLSAIS